MVRVLIIIITIIIIITTFILKPTYDVNHKPRRSGEKYGFSPPQSPMTGAPPELPPRIDRASKPPRTSSNVRSAQERLFGNKEPHDPPNYINATPHQRPANSSLERHNPTKTVSWQLVYDMLTIFSSYIFFTHWRKLFL